MAALHGAIALEQIYGAAMLVGEHLHFDVARPRQILLDQHPVVAEAAGRLALARSERRREIFAALDHPHALAAAARARLDQHRIADRIGFALQQLRHPDRRRDSRAPAARRRCISALAAAFEPIARNRLDRRSDEDNACRFASLRKIFVLRQKAVARMHRLRARRARRCDDAFVAKIALSRSRTADMHRFVARRDMFRIGVRVGIYRHARDAETLAGGGHPAGNLATVGDQNLVEHEVSR